MKHSKCSYCYFIRFVIRLFLKMNFEIKDFREEADQTGRHICSLYYQHVDWKANHLFFTLLGAHLSNFFKNSVQRTILYFSRCPAYREAQPKVEKDQYLQAFY